MVLEELCRLGEGSFPHGTQPPLNDAEQAACRTPLRSVTAHGNIEKFNSCVCN